VPTAGEGNRLSRLRMANEIQCILPYVPKFTCNVVFTCHYISFTCNLNCEINKINK